MAHARQDCTVMDSNKVFGQGGKAADTDKLNIDSIIARLLEGK